MEKGDMKINDIVKNNLSMCQPKSALISDTKRAVARYAILLTVLMFCISCSEKNSDSIAASGHPKLDQTAQFANHLVNLVNNRQGMNTPSKVVNYITSTSGSAELWPPSLEFEPDAAAYYKGPRPADGVGFSKGPALQGVFDREIVLIADDSNNIVITKAYIKGQNEPVFTWEWSLN